MGRAGRMHVHPALPHAFKGRSVLTTYVFAGRSRFAQSDIPWESAGNVSAVPARRSAIAGFAHGSTANSATLNPVDRSVGNLYRFSVYLPCELPPPREREGQRDRRGFVCKFLCDRCTVTELQISAVPFGWRLLYSACLLAISALGERRAATRVDAGADGSCEKVGLGSFWETGSAAWNVE